MSHFVAFYQCFRCGKTICGLVSNTMLMVQDAMSKFEGSIINPQQDEITQELMVFCPNCKPSFGANRMQTKCKTCDKKIEIFYLPKLITVIKPAHLGGGEMVIAAKRLLAQYEHLAFCSVVCEWVKHPNRINRATEPIFMKFRVRRKNGSDEIKFTCIPAGQEIGGPIMVGWAEECMSAEELVVDKLKELMALNPDHELIRYWIRKKDEETSPEIEELIKKEMKNRFWGRTKPWEEEAGVIVTTVVLTNYYAALREAVEKIKGISKPLDEPAQEVAAPTVVQEDDIPF